MKQKIISEKPLYTGHHLYMRAVEFIDHTGCIRSWESADRVNGEGGRGACLIVAHVVPDDEIILVRQFRPPCGKLTLEFPAGLIDPGETAADTALRELYEETGYRGRVIGLTEPLYSSPGLTGEPIIIAYVEVDGASYCNFTPEPHPEEVESFDIYRVKLDELGAFVAAQQAEGVGIDSKIITLIYGRALGRS
ncbi:MAG: NUDIX hydrolase [Victivallaceae bacterium]|nr:NUDIX hydrolase [Victivallaceae bacterium]